MSPQGWHGFNGLLEPDPMVAGYLARRQPVEGYCRRNDCRRRCEINLIALARAGFGPLSVTKVQALLRCNHPTGCGLAFETKRPVLPLKALFGRSHARIRITCGGCGFMRVASAEAVAAKIAAIKTVGESTPVAELAGRVRGVCRRCKKSAWRLDVLWPDTGTIGWRQRDDGSGRR